MDVTPILSLITSFLILSSLVWPYIQRSILIYVTFILCRWDFLVGQHLAPYSKVGLTTVRYTLPINLSGILLSHRTPDAFFHFWHPLFIRWLNKVKGSLSDLARWLVTQLSLKIEEWITFSFLRLPKTPMPQWPNLWYQTLPESCRIVKAGTWISGGKQGKHFLLRCEAPVKELQWWCCPWHKK